MLEATEDVLKAVLALQKTNPPAWIRFMDWFNRSLLSQSSKEVRIKDETELRWSQGRQQELSELIDLFNSIETRLGNKARGSDEFYPSYIFD